jgi:hypothetical protein
VKQTLIIFSCSHIWEFIVCHTIKKTEQKKHDSNQVDFEVLEQPVSILKFTFFVFKILRFRSLIKSDLNYESDKSVW